MKRVILAIPIIALTFCSYAQTSKYALSNTTVKKQTPTITLAMRREFAIYANNTFQNRNVSFGIMVTQHFARLGYDFASTSEFMESLDKYPKAFDEVLKTLWDQSSNKEILFMQFKSLGISASTANQLVRYSIYKFSTTE